MGLPTTMASILAMLVFEQVMQRYPGIRLQFFESMSGYLNELLANGRLDLAILFRDTNTQGISVPPVLDEELQVMGEPGGAAVTCRWRRPACRTDCGFWANAPSRTSRCRQYHCGCGFAPHVALDRPVR
jgi:DNA-binding transcriptional LysR family regulator